MAVSFPGFPWKFWSGGSKEKQTVKNGSSLDSLNSSSSLSSELGTETVQFKTRNGKWDQKGSEEKRVIDKEFDIVVVPSDGLHCSGYESDGPEWSIGWEEPHGSGFHDDEDGFAVLVPSYKPGCKELVNDPNKQFLSAIKNLPNGFFYEGINSLHKWVSSSRSR